MIVLAMAGIMESETLISWASTIMTMYCIVLYYEDNERSEE